MELVVFTTILSVTTAAAIITIREQQPRGLEIIQPAPSGGESTPETSPTPPAAVTASPSPADTSSPEMSCRNSKDPQCGEFYWDPDPGTNAPLVFDVTISPQRPQVGEEVTVTVTVRDPDSTMWDVYINFDVEMGWSGLCAPQERFGPWTPPERTPGSMTKTATHTFDEPGEHYVHVLAFSQGGCGASPYASEGSTKETFVVAPAPSPSPSGLLPT